MCNKQTTNNFRNDPPTSAILSAGLGAERRVALTRTDKFKALHGVLAAPQDGGKTYHHVDLDSFIELLKKFPKTVYNGIRVYIARYTTTTPNHATPGREGQLTLVFVPTTHDATLTTGRDDASNIWHFGAGSVPTWIPADIAKSWIDNYRNSVFLKLEEDGKEKIPDFKETKSLWYSMKTIAGGVNDIGLIAFLEDAKVETPNNPNPVVGVTVLFAAFLPDEGINFPEYQLTIIFNLNQKEDPSFLDDKERVDKNALVFGSRPRTVEYPADTGIPCPPEGNCPGSNFP